MQFIYKALCPNDGNDIISSRLEKGLVCEKCLPESYAHSIQSHEELIKYLEERNLLEGKLKDYEELEAKLREFEEFSKVVYESLTPAQRSWFMKASRSESFAITYPTGLGKTSFGVLLALYTIYKDNGKKVFFIVPTKLLVSRLSERLQEIAEKKDLKLKILKSGEKKEDIINSLRNREFNIAVFTPKFLIYNKDVLNSKEYTGIADLIFVDDVDALLKSSKAIDIVLNLLGFEESIQVKLRKIIKRTSREDTEAKTKVLEEIEAYKKQRKIGQLIFSSATTRYTSSRLRLLRYLLNFEPGSSLEVFRNIKEVYKFTKNEINDCINIVKKIGEGGLIFVSTDKPSDYLEKIASKLEEEGIKCEIVSGKTNAKKIIEKFEKGEVKILIGHAIFYGPLVRGIDMPAKVKYALFVGVPKFKFSFRIFERNPLRTLWLASLVVNFVEDFNTRRAILETANKLKNETQKFTPEALRALAHIEKVETQMRIFKLTKELYELLKETLKDENLVRKLEEKNRLKVLEEKGEKFFLIPDSLTYIQASGRTSRLYYGGITTGLSIILVDDKNIFEGLKFQLNLRSELFKFINYKEFEKEKEKILELIRIEREAIEKRDLKKLKELKKLELKTALFVVESPTKARTISSFFGKPVVRLVKGLRVYECVSDRYILYITATRGHIFDLVYTHDPNNGYYYGVLKKDGYIPIYNTIKKCNNCGAQFNEYLKEKGKCNYCGSDKIDDQIKTVEALQEIAQECDLVIIATDPDSEGEKIAKDVYLAVKPFAKEIKRAEMHEITLRAFLDALDNLRDVNDKLVEAQVLRRIGDRWVGFSLSNVVQQEFKRRTLGIGRVQGPVLHWIVKNYEKSKKEKKKIAVFHTKINDIRLRIISKSIDIKKRNLKNILKNIKIKVSKIKKKQELIRPPVPFSTTELLTYAIPRIKASSDKIMKLAQDLFEAGLITYHRTDSHYISYVGFEIAKRYLEEKNLIELHKQRQYGEKATHECIRPTRPLDRTELESAIATGQIRIPIQLTPQHYQLYDLIFRVFIASQMEEAKTITYEISFESLKVPINGEMKEIKLKPIKLNIKSDENSFAKIYSIPTYPQLENIKEGDVFEVEDVQLIKKKKALFTEEEIISKMKKEGIGRPSTYAIIIKKLIEHGYVFKSPNKQALIPTKTGIELIKKLNKEYKWVTDVKLTREFEETMDRIEKGELNKAEITKKLDEFFERFYELKKPTPIVIPS